MSVPNDFDLEQANEAIKALIDQNNKDKNEGLFLDISNRILLEVTAFRTPDSNKEDRRNHFFNIVLPNSPYQPIDSSKNPPDVILVLADEKNPQDEEFVYENNIKYKDPEMTVNKIRDKLRDEGLANIKQVLTFSQLRKEYSSFDEKRQLAKSVDVVLADQTIFKTIPKILGREFVRKKKFPISVKIAGNHIKTEYEIQKNISHEIRKALMKTIFNISVKGQTSTLSIGCDNLEVEELKENLSKVVNWLSRKFPCGKWSNIAKLALMTDNSNSSNKRPPLIIYLNPNN